MIALQLLAQSSSSSNSGSKHRRLRRSISNYSIRNTSARNNTTSSTSSSTSNNTTMSVHTRLMMVMLTVVLIASHMSVDGLSTASDRGGRKLFGGYRITPKFCRASKTLPRSDPRSHGPTICMFNHECTQRQGEVVGACMDGFLFGACCQIQGTVDSAMVVEQDIVQQSAAAQSYESYGLHMKKPTAGGGVQFDAATGGAALPTRRPTATTTTLAVQQAAAQAPGQFVYSSSGLDDDSINTIDAQLTNGNHYDGDTVSVVSSTVSPPSIYASRPGMPSQPKPQKPSTTLSPSSAPSSAPSGTGHAEVYVDDNPTGHDEYPTRIPTGPYGVGPVDTSTADGFTPDHYGLLADDILNSQSSEFTHSDITHPGVDAVLVDENGRPAGLSGYGSVGPEAAEVATTEAAAAKPTVQSTRLTTAKATYARPAFRPKPTKAAMFTTTLAAEPVMYDTTSTGTGSSASGSGSGSSATGTTGTGIGSGPDQLPKPQGTMSDNDIESIESIILMLNDTKTGPQYNASNAAAAAAAAAVVTRLPASTTEKLPDSSYRPPSTSYVYSSMPTRRPIQVHSTIASNYGAVDVGETDFHSVRPSGESIADHILTITKRPLLITAASFATTKQPTTQRLPDEIIITAGSSIATLRPTSAGTRPSTRRPTTSTTTTTTGAPSTSYVTGPTTPRPMKTTPTAGGLPSSSRRPTTSKPTNKINPPRRNHTEPASSTVYIFRPTLNAQPASSTTQQQSTHNNNINNNNVVYEHVIQSKPIMQYAAESTAALNVTAATSAPTTSATTTTTTTTTEPPVPTVLITPKPTANQVTSNTWSTNAQQQLDDDAYSTPLIKAPSTSYVYSPAPTQRPTVTVDHSSVTGGSNDYSTNFGVTNSYPSTGEPGSLPPLRPQAISNDFEDPGYYGPTSTFRPRPHLAASGNTAPATATPTPLIAFDVATVGSGADDVVTAQFDTNNFPPVRNPNLNITVGGMNAGSPGGAAIGGVGGAPLNDYDIATPVEFVEDAALNDKMGLLVSKIVESLQGNFEQLADVVYDDVVVRDPPAKPAASTKRPATSAAATTKRPVTRATTRKPTQSAVTNAAKPAAASATTGGVSTRPTARPSARPTVRPAAAAAAATSTTVTTRRPTSAKATTTVAPTKAPTTVRRTTKKPTTATAAAAAAAATTKRPPVTKLPTSTRRPVTKPPKQIVTTTVAQPVQDEIVEEDDDDDDDDEEEDDDDEEVAAANGEPAEQSTPFAEGRIQCGIRPQVKSGRIVGGKGATFGEFPWQVLVRESTWLGLFTKNKCGGVLISKNYVVTAAHCQPGFLASLVTVFGEFDISGDLEVKRSVTKNVKRVVVHREYDAATFENDLAMLELESPIHYDTHIVPICMPSDAADFTGRMATVTGWGRLKYGGGVPSVLQEVQVPVIENSVCQEMFHTAGHNKKILSSFLCAGYANGQKDSCEGDSGGPLVLQRQDGRWELAGTVSHGIKCAAPYLPGVYMRTTYYKPWLQSIAGVH